MPNPLIIIATSLVAYECGQQLREQNERKTIFLKAQAHADSLNMPLLVVGTPKFSFNHPCGDVTIDIAPPLGDLCATMKADVRDIPFPDNHFGAAFVSHVIEHLATIEDALQAISELERVADKVFIVSPSKYSLLAWTHPDHRLWVKVEGGKYIIEKRRL